MRLIITEHDHRFIDTIVAQHDPADWLITRRIESAEDRRFYIDASREELRWEITSVLIGKALVMCIDQEFGHSEHLSLSHLDAGVLAKDLSQDFRRTAASSSRLEYIVEGLTSEDTDTDNNRHIGRALNAARAV